MIFNDRTTPAPLGLLAALILALGFAASGFFVGQAITQFRQADRSVTVKGLVERNVRADTVQWSLSFSNGGDDLSKVYDKTRADQSAVTAFLMAGGLQQNEISQTLRVVDQRAREYGEGNVAAARYIVQSTVTVDSTKIDVVAGLFQKTGDLVQKNVVVGDNNVNFRFTALNAIKPEMLGEATRNARAAAEQFAQDSNAAVGSIKRANQGVFSIIARGQDFDNGTAIDKTVRVVTTVEYLLRD